MQVKLNKLALKKFSKMGKKAEMYLGNNKIGIEYSEVSFDSKELEEKHLNSDELKTFMEVKGVINKKEVKMNDSQIIDELDEVLAEELFEDEVIHVETKKEKKKSKKKK